MRKGVEHTSDAILTAMALCLAICMGCDAAPPHSNPHDPEHNTDRPRVVSIVPADGDMLVPRDQAVVATFSEEVYELSVDRTSFVVYDRNRSYVAGKIACDGRIVTFTPYVELASAQTYTVMITTAVTDYALNAMETQYEWSFQTAPAHVPETVLVEGGSYTMGSAVIAAEFPGDQWAGEHLSGPEHPVTVGGFHMGKYEVTVEEYAEYCVSAGVTQPASPGGGGRMPVTYVSWYDAVKYCNWLSDVTGLERCYSTTDGIIYVCDFSKNGYRLPTEAEWEFAARNRGIASGAQFSGFGGAGVIGDYAWFKDNSLGGPQPVGGKIPNALGFHDMSGNVREWCWDWNEWWLWYFDGQSGLNNLEDTYYAYCVTNNITDNPAGFVPQDGWPMTFSMRGGSWRNFAVSVRTALHADSMKVSFDIATLRDNDVGFRICRTDAE